jgi:hypothetical protein
MFAALEFRPAGPGKGVFALNGAQKLRTNRVPSESLLSFASSIGKRVSGKKYYLTLLKAALILASKGGVRRMTAGSPDRVLGVDNAAHTKRLGHELVPDTPIGVGLRKLRKFGEESAETAETAETLGVTKECSNIKRLGGRRRTGFWPPQTAQTAETPFRARSCRHLKGPPLDDHPIRRPPTTSSRVRKVTDAWEQVATVASVGWATGGFP